MLVKDLKKLIENLKDDLPILVSSSDHSYRMPDCYVMVVEYVQKNQKYFEYYDDLNRCPGGETKMALVIE